MKTIIQPRSHTSLILHASVSTRRLAPPIAALGRWLVLALVAGFTLAAPAQVQTTATATATVSYGFVVAYTVTDGGSGYTEPPVVTVLGGGGTGATAVVLVANGVVTRIDVVAPGSGYTSPPEVVISAPPAEPTVLALQMIPLVTIHGLPGDTNRIETSTSLSAGFEPVLPGGSLGSKRRLSRRTFCLAAGGAVCYGQPDERDVDAEFLPGAV